MGIQNQIKRKKKKKNKKIKKSVNEGRRDFITSDLLG